MPPLKAAIYCRCSTTEARQDTQSQIDSCVKYCEAQGWQYEVFSEYESAYRLKKRPIFDGMLERIRRKEFDILLVYMLDRFSRAKPTQIISDFNRIIEIYKCRFVSLKEGIDSDQAMFEIILMSMSWMAHNYSKMLGIRVREGIQVKKAKGQYHGGRPKKVVDMKRLSALTKNGRPSLRKLASLYNDGLPKNKQISHQRLRRALLFL